MRIACPIDTKTYSHSEMSVFGNDSTSRTTHSVCYFCSFSKLNQTKRDCTGPFAVIHVNICACFPEKIQKKERLIVGDKFDRCKFVLSGFDCEVSLSNRKWFRKFFSYFVLFCLGFVAYKNSHDGVQ